MDPQVTHNAAESRFETAAGDSLAIAQYVRRGDTIVFTHTEVPEPYEGKGLGNALAVAALDYARSEGLTVVPRCRFMASFIKRHEEYQDLLKHPPL